MVQQLMIDLIQDAAIIILSLTIILHIKGRNG